MGGLLDPNLAPFTASREHEQYAPQNAPQHAPQHALQNALKHSDGAPKRLKFKAVGLAQWGRRGFERCATRISASRVSRDTLKTNSRLWKVRSFQTLEIWNCGVVNPKNLVLAIFPF